MKLILRSDVDNLGRLGDTVTVKPGYGRNYLIPQGLAMLATDSNMRVFNQERNKLEAHMKKIRDAAASLAQRIEGAEVLIKVRTGEGDKLYGSVTRTMIGDALTEILGEALVDKKKILLDEPLRALGEYAVPVKLHTDVVVDLAVKVVRPDGTGLEVAAEEEAEEAAESEEATEEAAEEAPAEETENVEQA